MKNRNDSRSSSSRSSRSSMSRQTRDLAKEVEDKKHGGRENKHGSYDNVISISVGGDSWYAIIIKHDNNRYVGASQSGQKGSFIVRPGFSTFSDPNYVDTFVKQDRNDEKDGNKTVPIDFWTVNDFNNNVAVFKKFKATLFTNTGELKKTIYSKTIDKDNNMKLDNEPVYKWITGKKKDYKEPGSLKRSEWKQKNVETKQPVIGAGISIPQHDKIIKFGNVLLLYDRLIKHNMLSVKKKGGGNIENFKNVRVSDKFVDIITGAINKQNINDIYNELNEGEQQLYNILVQISGIHKYVKIPAPNIKFLKDKLKLIEGEIEAGNDNVLDDLYDILNKMVIVKVITKKQAIEHYNKYK